jgi:hypothetical protein
MKEELKDFIVSLGLINIGIYARTFFGEKKYTKKQILAMVLVGCGEIYILNLSDLNKFYVALIALISGVVMPNIIKSLIKAANKSEDKAAEKMSNKIDKLM